MLDSTNKRQSDGPDVWEGLETMPQETKQAVIWALSQIDNPHDPHKLVDLVGEYFNEHKVDHDTYEYVDLLPFLEVQQ